MKLSLTAAALTGISVFSYATCLVNATAWVVGYQSAGYTGWNMRQYDDLYVGNPREVAYIFGSNANTLPGAFIGSPPHHPSPQGKFDFNCIATPDEINDNARNIGFYVGGLNHNGVTVALCYIEYSGSELCDSDTISNPNELACNVWIVCQ
ncbi:hypothetical protein DFH05DRAFT_1557325 [Lentinula detonsa]|uniref:Uncharacterized protein n=1 Tax=Lentinula detonsa TaxID=2804962 RepID=A0A9W8P1W3_9AGAR|nr:hypothetical protein DFH05DRAFT_1557325 [Lentinula detonsa]